MWNLLVIAVSVNIFVLAVLLIAAFLLGYIVRTSLVRKCKERIFELERDMLRDNARILELEKEKADLLNSSSSTVRK
jgi:hypothetical protein